MNNSNTGNARRWLLALFNIVFLSIAVLASLWYANRTRQAQAEAKQSDFITTVESMKSVSQNYLDSERGYVRDWAAYINDHYMTLPQALEFLRQLDTNPSRFIHIVDMDTFSAWSTYYPAGEEAIDTYRRYLGDTEYERRMSKAMWEIYNDEEAEFSVLGKYMLDETVSTAVSVGRRVTLREDNGTKDYLLLRAVPVDALKKSWVFPAEYQSAEVGIMTRGGDYVVQSASMKSLDFLEYIRGYNFQDDYNRVNTLKKQLESTESGMLFYKNFRNEDCLWYYSSFGADSGLDILGMVRIAELQPGDNAWGIVFLICGTLAVLAAVDGVYLYQVNLRLRRAVRLANQANKAKSRFLSAMSHDIRTPMNAVLGMMSIARNNVNDPECVTQCLTKSMNAGRQLLTLINDVLDISKIESGQFVLTPSEVSLPKQIEELVEMMTPQMREKNQHFTCDADKLPHPYVWADPLRLNQVYMNLLSNAVKYTPNGGSIAMRLYEEEMPESGGKTCLVFCVSDTGIGMTEAFQKTMYQSFSRAISTQVNRTQGSGLGLSIVYQMVELMGGTISCDSAVGKGTTFTVRLILPVRERLAGGEKADDGGESDIRGMHLLVAEDNDLNWEIIETQLAECGITCERAESGRSCLEKISAAPKEAFDAILMDVQMPEMSGIEATGAIRLLPAEKNGDIPIVAMTADTFAEDVQACMDCGMNGHVAKPVDMVKLRGYLRKIRNKTL